MSDTHTVEHVERMHEMATRYGRAIYVELAQHYDAQTAHRLFHRVIDDMAERLPRSESCR